MPIVIGRSRADALPRSAGLPASGLPSWGLASSRLSSSGLASSRLPSSRLPSSGVEELMRGLIISGVLDSAVRFAVF
jgi:hypothetical protein